MHGLVLTAAGDSTRFGGGRSKVLLDLAGRPVLRHALDTFRRAVEDLAVVVTARPGDVREIEALAGDARVVEGGRTRQASVAAGLRALPDSIDVVLVHDAARPLVTVGQVIAVLDAARRHGAAALVLPVTDTLHGIDGTLGDQAARLTGRGADRSALAAAQTPQAARRTLLEAALRDAATAGFEGTDEVGLLLRAGVAVHAVEGRATNLKITTATDLEVAAALLAATR